MLLIFFICILLINCGCIFNGNGKLDYSISMSNSTNEDLWVTVYIDGKMAFKDLSSSITKEGAELGFCSLGYETEPGHHEFEVIIAHKNNTILYNKTQKINVDYNFELEIRITNEDVYIYIRNMEEDRKFNDPPKIKNGKYEKLNNTTYKFSVLYFDSEADDPTDAELIIFHKHLVNGTLVERNMTLHSLEYKNGSLYTDALYTVIITDFSEYDDYRFAFYDGYDMATPIDDTPYTQPIL